MQLIRTIPLLAVVLVVYNFFGLTMAGEAGMSIWDVPRLAIPLPSDRPVVLSFGELFICFTLGILFIELVKSSTASNGAMVEQALSTLTLVAYIVQFIISPQASEPVFFILMVICLVEVMAGFIIQIKVSRRDISVN